MAAVVLFWSNGVIANFRDNPHEAPNWAAVASMATSVAALVLLILGVLVRSSAGAIGWQDAAQHIGDTQTVCGPLQSMVTDSGNTFLNIGEEYPDPDRFTIVVWETTDLPSQPRGTRVCLKGQISEYQGVPQMETRDADALAWQGTD